MVAHLVITVLWYVISSASKANLLLPTDKAGKFEYGLAIFSDDGTNVKVNGQQILGRYGRGQGLPNLAKSFSVLPISLTPGVEADFIIDYSNTHYTGNDDIDGCTLFFYLVPKLPIEFITPAGDPVASPVDAGNDPAATPDGANEFTYNSAAPGVLTVKLKAELPDLDSMPDAEKAKFTFEIDGIGTSTFIWDDANPDGKPEISGDFLTATATYTVLPRRNKDFGLKKARIMYDGAFVKEEDFEVFFPRDAVNHPDGQAGSPNWYHYWSQALGVSGEHTYDGTLVTSETTVNSATTWQIKIAPNANWPGGNPPTNQKHINGFWASNLHENWHRDHRVHNYSIHGSWSPPDAEDADGDGVCDHDPGEPAGHGGGWESQIGTDPEVPDSTEVGANRAETLGNYTYGQLDWSNPGTNNITN
jgi:hypothetical protein